MEALHPTELAAVITGLIYVLLAARGSSWCWPWGIVSAALWAYATYTLYDLISDAILQLFYVGMGIWGWSSWLRKDERTGQKLIEQWLIQDHAWILIIGLLFGLAFGYFFDTYTSAAATYLDAVTTVFAMVATWLTVRKVLENWIYWIVVDAVYVYLYWSRGSQLFTGLMVFYIVIAIFGWIEWKRQLQQQLETEQS